MWKIEKVDDLIYFALRIYDFQHQSLYCRLEDAISRSRIKLRNDSLSYAQLLESLPNDQAKEYDHIAQIVLKASVQLLNANCLERDVSSVRCAKEIAKYSLPPGQLLDKCKAVQQHSHRKGIHIYRRLLPAHYNDGLYKVFFPVLFWFSI